MKIDKLPIRLLLGAAALYLFSIGVFVVLSQTWRISVPQASAISLAGFGQQKDSLLWLRTAEPFPEAAKLITIKYFDKGIPRYLQLENPVPVVGLKNNYQAKYNGSLILPENDSLSGFVHLMKPIEQPLLDFLLE